MEFPDSESFKNHSKALLTVDPDTFRIEDVNEQLAKKYDIQPAALCNSTLEELFTDQTLHAAKIAKDKTNFPLVTVGKTTFQPGSSEQGESHVVNVNIFRSTLGEQTCLLVELERLNGGLGSDDGIKISFFNHLLYHFPDTIYFKDLESRFLLINSKQAEVLGIDRPDEAVGLTDFDFFPEEEAQDSYKDEQYIIETGESIKNKREKVTTGETGEYWVSTTKVPLHDEDGQVIGTMGITRDITKRKKLEEDNYRLLQQERDLREQMERAYENLQLQKEQFQGAFEKAAIGMALVSKEGKFMRVNDSLCSILGYDCDELTRLKFQDITHPEDLEKDLDKLEQLLEGKIESYTIEKRYYHKKGHTIWAILSVSLVKDSEGEPLHFVSQIQDISERKEYEQEINESLEEKRVLLEEIHHRVKNNLASVSGILELQIYNSEDSEVREGLEDAQSRIHTMALVHELLYQHDSLSNIHLGEYVEQLVDTIQNSLNTSDKDIKYHVESDEVPLDITKAVPCGLILNELITNAFKHGFKERNAGNIWIDITKKGQHVNVKVLDDGVGLPSDFSLENQDTLGVNLINTLISQLEGDISFKSGEDGTQFDFDFTVTD